MRRSAGRLFRPAVLLWLRCCLATDVLPENPSGGRFLVRQQKESIPESEPVHTATVGSGVQCALLCLRWPACLAANFRPTDGTASGSCVLLGSQAGSRSEVEVAGALSLRLPGSCRQLYQVGYREDGVYRHRGLPTPLYCDMTLNGGGWTLLAAAVSTEGWTVAYVLQRRLETPGIDIDYSIVGFGDQIKRLSNRSLFKYRIEVGGRHRWGGMWEAPKYYTLSGSHSNQTEGVRRFKTFDDWGPPTSSTLRDIVPWVNRHGAHHGYPLLTTCSELGDTWWGTLITANAMYGVSPWVESAQAELTQGARLYWVKEA